MPNLATPWAKNILDEEITNAKSRSRTSLACSQNSKEACVTEIMVKEACILSYMGKKRSEKVEVRNVRGKII